MPFVPTSKRPYPSLGYQIGHHIERYLGIELMVEQALRLVRLYRLDTKGRREVRRGALRRGKGAGKSPEGGYIGFGELTGPVIFSHWDENGQPVGKPHVSPWIQLAAVSEDQTDNVSVWLYDTLSDNPDTLSELGIDLGRTRIYLKNRPGRLETVTAAAGSREGQPVTFAVKDQSEAWTKRNGGVRLSRTLDRNVSKNDGWTYELQNAPGLDDGSVASQTQKDWERGFAGIFFDTREPEEVPNLDDIRSRCEGGVLNPEDRAFLLKGLREVYGESAERGYVNIERLADESVDPSTTVSDQIRFYFNTPYADADHWIDARSWDSLSDPPVKAPDAMSEITAGFVGRAYQGAALIACHIETGNLWTVRTWETTDQMVSRSEVNAAVDKLMADYLVRRFYVNPQEWASEYDAWHLAYGESVVSRPPQQTANMAYAVDRFRTAVGASELHHDGNEVLRRHILGAQTKNVAAGTLIVARTESPTDQITAAKAAVLAWEARADVLAAAEEEVHSPNIW